MNSQVASFGNLFRKFRLRAGFKTLSEFGDVLAERGFPYENSFFSYWQKNSRVPKDRKLLLTIIDIFTERGGFPSTRDVNILLESANQGYLTEQESIRLVQKKPDSFKKLNITPKKILEFLCATNRSKKLIRTGWIRWAKGRIKKPESVAEHSFQVNVITMIFADRFAVDNEKLIKMAILHDLGELSTGDVAVWKTGKLLDVEKKLKKETAELVGITKMFDIIGKSEEYKKIFEEMIEERTLDAKIFWQLDKLGLALQALVYEKEYNNRIFNEIFITCDLLIKSSFLRKIFKEILKNRPKLKKMNNKVDKILKFLFLTARSKRVIRAGWKREKIKNPESIADHSSQLIIMAMILTDHFGVDKERLIKMSIIHDLGEVITGDIVWARGKIMDLEKRAKKEKAELAGIIKMFGIIDKSEEYKEIFEEMIEGKSLEAKVFWELDKLEVAIQALIYEKEHNKKLDEFFVYADLQIHDPLLRKIFKEVLKQRPKIK